MKLMLRIALIISFFTLVKSSNLQAQETRGLESFDAISVTGNIEVVLEKGTEEGATIYTENIPESKVSVFVKRGTLKLKVLDGIFYKNEKVKIKVQYQHLRSIKAMAGANISSNSIIETELSP